MPVTRSHSKVVRVEGRVAYVPLRHGLVAALDARFADQARQHHWCADRRYPGKVYVATKIVGQKLYLHALVWRLAGRDPAPYIDHRRGDGLDNRLSNLRASTAPQNCANRGPNKNNTSGFKGVTYSREKRKWQAQITVNRRNISLGRFDLIDDAVRAYDEAALRYQGEFARPNSLETEGGR